MHPSKRNFNQLIQELLSTYQDQQDNLSQLNLKYNFLLNAMERLLFDVQKNVEYSLLASGISKTINKVKHNKINQINQLNSFSHKFANYDAKDFGNQKQKQTKICWYHLNFNENAFKCQYPCSFRQEKHTQKTKFRTFYNSKIKSNFNRNYVTHLITQTKKEKNVLSKSNCRISQSDFLEIKKPTEIQVNNTYSENNPINISKLTYNQIQATEKYSQLKQSVKEVLNESTPIKTLINQHCQTMGITKIHQETRTNKIMSHNISTQTEKASVNKTVQTIHNESIKYKDKYTLTVNTENNQPMNKENFPHSKNENEPINVDKNYIELDFEKGRPENHQTKNQINSICYNNVKHQDNNIKTEKSTLTTNFETFKFAHETNSKNKFITDVEKQSTDLFLKALVRNKTDGGYNGPYKIIDMTKHSFILDVMGTPTQINGKRIQFISDKNK